MTEPSNPTKTAGIASTNASKTSPAATTNPQKCGTDSRRCRNGTGCVPLRHICDGMKNCPDGSDEEECGEFSHLKYFVCFFGVHLTFIFILFLDASNAAAVILSEKPRLNESPFTRPPIQQICTSPMLLCPASFVCIHPTQLCNGKEDCPDGSDESCVKRCLYGSK